MNLTIDLTKIKRNNYSKYLEKSSEMTQKEIKRAETMKDKKEATPTRIQ